MVTNMEWNPKNYSSYFMQNRHPKPQIAINRSQLTGDHLINSPFHGKAHQAADTSGGGGGGGEQPQLQVYGADGDFSSSAISAQAIAV